MSRHDEQVAEGLKLAKLLPGTIHAALALEILQLRAALDSELERNRQQAERFDRELRARDANISALLDPLVRAKLLQPQTLLMSPGFTP